jgi:hypothetical protein
MKWPFVNESPLPRTSRTPVGPVDEIPDPRIIAPWYTPPETETTSPGAVEANRATGIAVATPPEPETKVPPVMVAEWLREAPSPGKPAAESVLLPPTNVPPEIVRVPKGGVAGGIAPKRPFPPNAPEPPVNVPPEIASETLEPTERPLPPDAPVKVLAPPVTDPPVASIDVPAPLPVTPFVPKLLSGAVIAAPVAMFSVEPFETTTFVLGWGVLIVWGSPSLNVIVAAGRVCPTVRADKRIPSGCARIKSPFH